MNGDHSLLMKKSIHVQKIGDFYGFLLDEKMLADLGINLGDAFLPVRVAGGVAFVRYDHQSEDAIKSTRDYMHRHRNALHKLSKL